MLLRPGIILLTCFLVNPELKKEILWQQNVYIVTQVVMEHVVKARTKNMNTLEIQKNVYIVDQAQQVVVQKVLTVSTKDKKVF